MWYTCSPIRFFDFPALINFISILMSHNKTKIQTYWQTMMPQRVWEPYSRILLKDYKVVILQMKREKKTKIHQIHFWIYSFTLFLLEKMSCRLTFWYSSITVSPTKISTLPRLWMIWSMYKTFPTSSHLCAQGGQCTMQPKRNESNKGNINWPIFKPSGISEGSSVLP